MEKLCRYNKNKFFLNILVHLRNLYCDLKSGKSIDHIAVKII